MWPSSATDSRFVAWQMGNPSIGIDAAWGIGIWSIWCCATRKMAWFNRYGCQNDEKRYNVRRWFHRRSQSHDVSFSSLFFHLFASFGGMSLIFLVVFYKQKIATRQFGPIVWCVLQTSANLHCHGIHETWISIELPQTSWNITNRKYGTLAGHVHTGWKMDFTYYSRIEFAYKFKYGT